jgi:hypothetical protein
MITLRGAPTKIGATKQAVSINYDPEENNKIYKTLDSMKRLLRLRDLRREGSQIMSLYDEHRDEKCDLAICLDRGFWVHMEN